jgi:hypothetical protein
VLSLELSRSPIFNATGNCNLSLQLHSRRTYNFPELDTCTVTYHYDDDDDDDDDRERASSWEFNNNERNEVCKYCSLVCDDPANERWIPSVRRLQTRLLNAISS